MFVGRSLNSDELSTIFILVTSFVLLTALLRPQDLQTYFPFRLLDYFEDCPFLCA
jgi:hypothetical protein